MDALSPIFLLYPAAFVLSALLAVYFTGMMRGAALKWGVLDKPNTDLKKHRAPVPYLGGVGIYLGFLLAYGLLFSFTPAVLGLLLSGTIMLLIGLIDDLGVLTPGQKFLGQSLAAFALIRSGVQIDVDFFQGIATADTLPWIPLLNLVLTFLWVTGMTNALNIIDISDGLAGATAFVAALFLFAVAVLSRNLSMALVAITLAGSLLGFLWWNWHPARIFMGDAGALFVGMMLSAVAMGLDYSRHNPVAYVGPLLILGVPLFDLVFVSILRLWKGKSPFHGSPDHFAIRLKRVGVSVPGVALISAGTTAVLGFLALFIMRASVDLSLQIVLGLAIFAVLAMTLLARIDVKPRSP